MATKLKGTQEQFFKTMDKGLRKLYSRMPLGNIFFEITYKGNGYKALLKNMQNDVKRKVKNREVEFIGDTKKKKLSSAPYPRPAIKKRTSKLGGGGVSKGSIITEQKTKGTILGS